MQNKEEFIKEYHYIKTIINKINLISSVFETELEILNKLIDHYIYLLAKAFNLSETIDIIFEMCFLDTLTIDVYNEENILCDTIKITENNLYEKLIELCNKRYVLNAE